MPSVDMVICPSRRWRDTPLKARKSGIWLPYKAYKRKRRLRIGSASPYHSSGSLKEEHHEHHAEDHVTAER